MRAVLARDARHHRDQVEEAVRDVEGDDAVGLHMPEIDPERLARDEMHRDRVAREGVDREHVEVLRRLAPEGQARVDERDIDGPRAGAEVGGFRTPDAPRRPLDIAASGYIA